MKKVTNMVAMDGTFYYYYDNQRPIETRVVMRDQYDSIVAMPILKQQVWGAPGSSYVDELVQIAINQDPQNADVDGDGYEDTEDENICERFFYVMQDANYNVLGLTSATGQLVERYEYTPYGQRTIHSHGWIRADLDDDGMVGALDLDAFGDAMNGNPDPDDRSDLSGNGQVATLDLDIFGQQWGDTLPSANDPLVMYPRYRSFRNTDGHGDTQATPLCEFGHQGLIHDEEFMVTGMAGSNLIYNRARTLNPGLARFMQRDPLGYVDGMSVYEYVKSQPITQLDSSGKITVKFVSSKLDNLNCGDRAYVRWDFWLDNKAECDGYIVQEVESYCTISNCKSNNCSKKLSNKPTITYWEAWPVSKGERLHELQGHAGFTDQARRKIYNKSCGKSRQFGTIKFFCKDVTGDLGTYGRNAPSSGWATHKTYGSGGCRITPDSLPSTNIKPSWWNSSSPEKTAKRTFSSSHDCCCSGKVEAYAYPNSN